LRLSRDRKSWRETHQTLLKDLNNSSSIATINDRGVAHRLLRLNLLRIR